MGMSTHNYGPVIMREYNNKCVLLWMGEVRNAAAVTIRLSRDEIKNVGG